MINVIKKVSSPQKIYNLTDNLLKTRSITNAVLDKDKIKSVYQLSQTSIRLPDIEVLRGYEVVGKFFVYCTDGAVYQCLNGIYYFVVQTGVVPAIIAFTHQGEEKALIAWNYDEAIVVSDSGYQTISFYSVDKMVLHAGRLFSSLNNQISFSSLYDFDDTNISFPPDGTIFIPEQYGYVYSMIGLGDRLYVFTKSAVFYLSCSGESIDFKLKRLESVRIDALECSICKVNDRILFIENNKIRQLKDDEVSTVDSFLENGAYQIVGNCASGNGKYFVPISDENGNKAIFIYDATYQTQGVTEIEEPIVCDSGFMFNYKKRAVMELIESSNSWGSKYWGTVNVDFNSNRNKVINRITLNSKKDCKLIITGNFGKIVFNVVSGYNSFDTNLPSREYGFEINASFTELEIADFKVYYREMEK